MSNQELPHDLEAEKALVGSLIIDSKYVNRVAEIVQPADFFDKRNRVIFDHLCRMTYEHEPIDLLTVVDRLDVAHVLPDIGGRAYLIELQDDVYSAANCERYAEIVKEKAQLRALHGMAVEVCKRVKSQDDPGDISAKMISQAMAIGGEVGIRSVLLSDRAVEILKPAEGLPTGFVPLDREIVCLENGTLSIFAGFTGMGKSTMLSTILYNITQTGVRAGLVDLEMTDKQRGHRTMSAATGIALQRIRRWNNLTPEEQQRCESALAKDRIEYLFADDMKPIQLYRFLDREVPLGLKLIAVDYLQLMEADHPMQRRDLEVGYVSRSLKKMAKHFNIPVIAISQFAKPKESQDPMGGRKKQGARPHIGLMRESGRIAEDADLVVFVHRNSMTEGELIIAKQRQGPKTIIKTTFRTDTATFEEA